MISATISWDFMGFIADENGMVSLSMMNMFLRRPSCSTKPLGIEHGQEISELNEGCLSGESFVHGIRSIASCNNMYFSPRVSLVITGNLDGHLG